MKREFGKVHFIGIGDVRMSGLARIALAQGYEVSGSDLRRSRYTDRLSEAGAAISIGHAKENIPADVDAVVVGKAILSNNPELCTARERGLRMLDYAEMLGIVSGDLDVYAVAGTFGKATAGAMLVSAIDALGFDPSFLLVNIVNAYGVNARPGKGSPFVIETGEGDGSFATLFPRAVLLTGAEDFPTAEADDGSEGSAARYGALFERLPEDGIAVVPGDDTALLDFAKARAPRTVSYGVGEDCDVRMDGYRSSGMDSSFALRLSSGKEIECALSNAPGSHNAVRAAGVVAFCEALGYDAEAAAKVLADFGGVRRRFDMLGEAGGITVMDDCVNHPAGIALTVRAAMELGYKRVTVLYQPYRYSSAPLFAGELRELFSSAFDGVDHLIFTDVYSAGETPVPGVNGRSFLEIVNGHPGAPRLDYVQRRRDIVPFLYDVLGPGDLLLTIGPGDVASVGSELLQMVRDGSGISAEGIR